MFCHYLRLFPGNMASMSLQDQAVQRVIVSVKLSGKLECINFTCIIPCRRWVTNSVSYVETRLCRGLCFFLLFYYVTKFKSSWTTAGSSSLYIFISWRWQTLADSSSRLTRRFSRFYVFCLSVTERHTCIGVVEQKLIYCWRASDHALCTCFSLLISFHNVLRS